MPREHIHTDFMDRQAKENAKSGTARGFFIGFGILALVGVGFGGMQAVNYFSNFESNQFKRNVAINLKSPKVVGGKAVVSVDLKNSNAFDVSNPVFNYSIEGKDNKVISKGQVSVEGIVPAADRRTFDDVPLGEVTGQPARMHSDLVSLTVNSEVRPLPKGYPARFTGAMQNTGAALISALKPLVEEQPEFEAGHIALGLAYQEQEDWANALKEFQRASELNPKSANAKYHEAMVFAHENKQKESEALLRKASDLSPQDPAIQKALSANGAATPEPSEAEE